MRRAPALFALPLLALASCVVPAPTPREPRTRATPPYPGAPPGAATPLPSPGATTSPPPSFVQLDGGGGTYCGRTDSGELWCWGDVDLPGSTETVEVPQPMRIEGLPPLAGFTIAGQRSIVGWDHQGAVVTVSLDPSRRERSVVGVHDSMSVMRELPRDPFVTPGGAPQRVSVVAGRDGCVQTTRGELLCTHAVSPSTRLPTFVRAPFEIAQLGTGPCAIDRSGVPIAFTLQPAAPGDPPTTLGPTGAPMSPLAANRLDAFGGARAVACLPHRPSPNERRIDACALQRDGTLGCTEPRWQRALESLRDGHAVTSVFSLPRADLVCITRSDRQARCISPEQPHMAELAASLVGLDASRGVVASRDPMMCALGQDGVPRCWGVADHPGLGDGSTRVPPRPVHLPAYDGADRISGAGNVTCVRLTPTDVRCFGRHGASRVEPAPLLLPEPVDEIVGGFPLCVRGAQTRAWYCRDPFETFFRGTLPGGFEPVRDARGRPLGAELQSIAVDAGLGIQGSDRRGDVLTFGFALKRQALRFTRSTLRRARVARIAQVGRPILVDGSARIGQTSGTELELPAPIADVAGTCYVAADTRELRCVPPGARGTGAIVVARDIVQLGGALDALTASGEVLVPNDPQAPHEGFRRVDGLPPMQQVARRCGLSRERQVWCWGTAEQLDGPAMRGVAPVSLPGR